jgi:hypothetical protein
MQRKMMPAILHITRAIASPEGENFSCRLRFGFNRWRFGSKKIPRPHFDTA